MIDNNNRLSYIKRSRYINIRYFYVKDLIDNREAEVEYYPTKQMIANFFAKPLQSSLFKNFQVVIFGHILISNIYLGSSLKSKEHIESIKVAND